VGPGEGILVSASASVHREGVVDAFSSLRPTVLLDVPTCLQEAEHLCGPAALEAVLAYHGVAATQRALARRLGTTRAGGTSLRAVARVAAEHGLAAELLTLDLPGLRALLDRGVPCVLLLQAWGAPAPPSYRDRYEDGHHAVAIGYADGAVLFADPRCLERTVLTDADLLERWHSNGTPATCLERGAVAVRGPVPSPGARWRPMG